MKTRILFIAPVMAACIFFVVYLFTAPRGEVENSLYYRSIFQYPFIDSTWSDTLGEMELKGDFDFMIWE